jgi:hypothetical protein
LLERPPNLAGYFDELSSDTIVELGKQHYRRSEADYPGYDKFRARLAFGAHGESLYVGIDVRKDDLIFRERDAPDPRLDNETPDIHSDGVQFYVDVEGWRGFVVIPEPGADTVRVELVAGTSAEPGQLSAKWETTSEGYALLLRFDAGALFGDGSQVLVQVVVNEMRSGRVRRAGQLAVAAGGGWTYLRGDRESPDNAAILEIK